MRIASTLTLIILLGSMSCRQPERQHWDVKSEDYNLRLELVADSIEVPYAMAFLPSGELLVTDRPAGSIIRVDEQTGRKTFIKGVPAVWGKVDGGMLDIVLHPEYSTNGWIYYSYATMKEDSTGTLLVERARLKNDSLTERQLLFTALPYYKEPNHFGTRMVLRDGYLFITMGERFDFLDSAQTLSNHMGKIMRIHDDGRVPADNPFVNTPGARPEIWSYGHRNAQGLVFHPETGKLWEHEHGPKGGDEVNIIEPGLNYGWPVICYGIGYDDKPIGAGITHHDGMEQPYYHYTPSIAPSGMEFYTGDDFPKWKGNLFIGAMVLRHLNRLVMGADSVMHEERLLPDNHWRVRSVTQSPQGVLYIGVDKGMVLKIRPAD